MDAILKSYGLDFIDAGMDAAAILVLLVLVIILFCMLIFQRHRTHRLEERVDHFMQGSQAGNLEEDIARIFDENQTIMQTAQRQDRQLQMLTQRQNFTIQKVGVVKYDAFHQMGGNLSYAIVLLDGRDDGIIINSVQSVNGCYSYIKIVKDGVTDVDLGTEEQQAMDIALGRTAAQ